MTANVKKQLAKIIAFTIFSVSVLILVVIVNQTIQIVQFMGSIHPALGYLTATGLLAIYGGIILVPLISYLRLPQPLHPPESETDPEFEKFLQELGQRLARNPALQGENLQYQNREAIEAGLRILDQKADRVIQDTASVVFVNTAISQNGRLDGILVFITQVRMVWQLVHLYQQRPNWGDVLNIYVNVFATALIVSNIEDLDVTEQIEPLVTSVLGNGVVSAIPGTGAIAAIITNSIIEGTANAYLTLRVGIVCKSYNNSMVQTERKTVREGANVQAAKMLGGIVRDSSLEVTRAVGNVVRKMGSGALVTIQQGATDGVSNLKKTATGVTSKISRAFVREKPEAEEAIETGL